MASKNSLRTSEEIYHRLRWDPALPAARVWIGYLDRMVGERELPLLEFNPGGRIPWSRIWFFRLDDERIWDRRTRLDRVFGSGDTPADQILPRLQQHSHRAAGVSAHPTYRYSAEQDAWIPSGAQPQTLPDTLSVVSLNVLFDTYQPEALDSPRRHAAILAMLEDLSPDLVALQEVKRPFLEQLLATPWARRYTCSDIPERATTIKPYGQVLLSRCTPARLLMLRLSKSKRAIIAAFETGGVPLEVAVIHLTSDHREDAHARRIEQVSLLLSALDPSADHIIVGDFNYGDDQSIPQLSEHTDAWRFLHPNHPGFTYAPSQNRLAALNSRLGIDRRLDRLVFRAPPDRLLASEAALIADQPIDGVAPVLHPSDHFGLRVSLLLQATRSALAHSATTVMSALAILPPLAAWGPLQATRRRHDPSFERWMPHINLLYGFFPPTLQAAAAAVVAEVVAEDAERTITLSSVEVFQHTGRTTVYLAPDPPSAAWLAALQVRLRKALPQCTDQDRAGRFTPHLTVARVPCRERIPAEVHTLVPCTVPVSVLSVLSRTEQTPFREAIRIPLGGGPIHADPPAPGRTLAGALELLGLPAGASAQREQAWRAVHDAAAGQLFRIGSSRLGIARPDSDLDVVLVGRGPRAAAWTALEEALGVQGRWVEAARVPVLKLEVSGVAVDVLYAAYPEPLPLVDPCALSDAQWASLEPASRQAAVACREAEALLEVVGPWRSVWQVTARALRAWASARQIDSQGVGFPGGLAWSIISAAVPPRTSPEAWLGDILEHLFATGWEQPRGLGTLPEPSGDPVTVWTSCAPRHNATASVLPCTRAVLQAEVERALELIWTIQAGELSWVALFVPVAASQPENRIELRVETPDAREEEAGLGWLKGNLLGLLFELENLLGEQVRPLSSLRDGAMVIGLDPHPQGEQVRRVQERLDDFVAQFPGPGHLDARLTSEPA